MKATLCGALAALALCATARADFNAALADYQAGHYDSARRQFTAMAELGDCSSQFNLGVMVLQGQGGPRDVGAGVGWLKAAAANGCQELVGGRVEALKGSLSLQEERKAADVLDHYGHDALHAVGIVDPVLDCPDRIRAAVLQAPAPEYPRTGNHHSNGLVIAELTIGVDGRPRDPEILFVAPDEAFAAAAVEAWLHSRFTPASRNGKAVETRQQLRIPFVSAGGEALWSSAPYKDSRAAAEAGDPAAEYLVGLAASADPSLGVGPARGTELVIFAARDGNPKAQYWLGEQLRSVQACHPKQSGAEWLRHAAGGGDASAQVALAADLVSANPSDAQVGEARALLQRAAAADSYYARKHLVALLAASPLAALRDPPTAQQVAAKLSAGGIQSDPQMFEVLAAAAAAGGDFAVAVAQQETAIRKAHDLAWNTHAMEERLAAYKGGKPWQGDLFAG
jgi:TPR repeat protein